MRHMDMAYLARHLDQITTQDLHQLEPQMQLLDHGIMRFLIQKAIIIHERLQHDYLEPMLIAQLTSPLCCLDDRLLTGVCSCRIEAFGSVNEVFPEELDALESCFGCFWQLYIEFVRPCTPCVDRGLVLIGAIFELTDLESLTG